MTGETVDPSVTGIVAAELTYAIDVMRPALAVSAVSVYASETFDELVIVNVRTTEVPFGTESVAAFGALCLGDTVIAPMEATTVVTVLELTTSRMPVDEENVADATLEIVVPPTTPASAECPIVTMEHPAMTRRTIRRRMPSIVIRVCYPCLLQTRCNA